MSLRIGFCGYATEQGLGMLGKAFYEAGLTTEALIHIHPHFSRPTHREWYPNGLFMNRPFRGPEVNEFLKRIDVCLFFETAFDWPFVTLCRERGIKTAIIPMYEWHAPMASMSKDITPDLYICPSLLDLQYFPDGVFLPVPVDPSKWQQRYQAKRFLHNGGHLGCRGHKGTLEIMQAMEHVKSPLHLTIRSQDIDGLNQKIRECPSILGNPQVAIERGPVPYESLFSTDYDVFIMAEKFNGLSLPLQEARAAGMLVMTSDRFPMNTWLPQEALIPVESYHEARVSAGHNLFQEAVVNPRDIAAKMDEVYGSNIEGYSEQSRLWAMENSWEALKPKYIQVLEDLCNRR